MPTRDDPFVIAEHSKARFYVLGVIVLCLAAAIFVVAITAIRPTADNTALIATVLGGIIGPVVTALMAAALYDNHRSMNSRLTELLILTSRAAKAEGRLEGAESTREIARNGMA